MENVSTLEARGCGVGEAGFAAVDGEGIEDSDSDEEYSSILRPAFLVDGDPDFDSGPPEDGLEYLRRVRWEAARIPKVKVAKVDRSNLNKDQTVYMPTIPDIAKCPDHLLPSKGWEDAFLADFSELRKALSDFEASYAKDPNELQSSFTFHEFRVLPENTGIENIDEPPAEEADSFIPSDCSPLESPNADCSPTASNNETSLLSRPPVPKSSVSESPISKPTLSAVLGMEPAARVSALRRRIGSVEPMGAVARDDCLWLFALCATVDMPLDADTCASLRCLLRKCASLRAAKSEPDDEVVMLNILVTISGRYFGQLEK